MTRKQERNIIALSGTTLFMGLVFLLLWLLQLVVSTPKKQDSLEVFFEDIETPEPEPEVQKVVKTPAPSKQDPGASTPANSEPTNQPTQTSTEQIVSEEELLAIRQQQIADSIAEANRQAKKKAEDLIGGFSFSPTETEGSATNTSSQKGNGTSRKGEGTEGDIKWSLAGRGLVGSLPKPMNTFNQEGTVVVRIWVDASGKVIDTEVIGGTVSDKATTQLAVDAAKKAKFTADKNLKQVGTITYTFKFN